MLVPQPSDRRLKPPATIVCPSGEDGDSDGVRMRTMSFAVPQESNRTVQLNQKTETE